jgi:hypothetical protein
MKKPTNPGLKKLPQGVRNKMGYMADGGDPKDEPAAGMPGGKATPEALGAEKKKNQDNERLQKIIDKMKKEEAEEMSYGGKVKKMAYGGKAMKMADGKMVKKKKKTTKVARRRGDGCAVKGKTRGRMV